MKENTTIKLSLEKNMNAWVTRNCETLAWAELDFYSPDTLSTRMAEAAYTVLITAVETHDWIKDQIGLKE